MIQANLSSIIDKIQTGSICVMPTDTVYGLIATTNQRQVVERIYDIKDRATNKPFIILISEISQLRTFSVKINQAQANSLSRVWPGPVSVILPCPDEALIYLHRGERALAFRIPKLLWLRELIDKTGPVIATSANKAGMPVACDLNVIKRQLPNVDLFIQGPTSTIPSRLGRMQKDGSIDWIQRA